LKPFQNFKRKLYCLAS